MNAAAAPGRGRRVILAGDSTTAPYIAPAYPMCGWGAHLGAPLNARLARGAGADAVPVHVIDLAKNGASTGSHRADGLWAAVLDATGPGDLVVLQFGHNDEKREHLDAWGGFTMNLRRMVGEVRDLDAEAVLCTPVARRRFEDGRVQPTHGEYPAAVRALAEELDVMLLDLSAATGALLADLGEQGSRRLFTHLPAGHSVLYPEGIEDNTHFSIEGAIAVAEIVAEQLASMVGQGVCGVGCGSTV